MEQIDEKFNYPNINDVWRFCSSKVLKAAAMQSRNILSDLTQHRQLARLLD